MEISRRKLIQGAAGIAGGAAFGKIARGRAADSTFESGPSIVVSSRSAVVPTGSGRVRGYTRGGIYTFKGIPYGAPTGGAARFKAPARPETWSGVRSTLAYGPICPQGTARNGITSDETAFLFSPDYGSQDEDCLRLNVWTPGLGTGERRPVMVWLHGGGFVVWSGQYLPSFHGENLSRSGDVVVVAVTHRLGLFGFLNVAEIGGREFAGSANAGMLDLVLALEWVRDNIAGFGGDPGNVTIFGQSGGGGKVSALMAMPAARGLFHKAVAQSGSRPALVTARDGATLTAALMGELGLGARDLGRLQGIAPARLIAAGDAALGRLAPPPAPGGLPAGPPRFTWRATIDGGLFPAAAFETDAPAQSASVPMLIGTVLNEAMPGFFSALPEPEDMTLDDVIARLRPACGDQAPLLLAAYRRSYPGVKPIELKSIIYSASVRNSAVDQAGFKWRQKSAPAYLYQFSWHTPVLDGWPRAFHCSELAFVFNNTDRCGPMTGGGPAPRELAARVSAAWAAFARRGNPNHPGLPAWPEFDPARGSLMVFDTECRVQDDPDREARLLFRKIFRRHPAVAS